MKRRKGKDMFIKYYITRDIHTPILGIKALIAFVKRTIANENTLLGTES
jgi:hypothetical protein